MIKHATRYCPAILSRTTPVLPSVCGADKHLSTHGAFSLLVDAAAVHSELIGTGCRAMAERRLFWLMTRARIRFHERPAMMEDVTLTTWPKAPRHYLCDRFYTVERDGRLLLEGRQEWAVLSRESGKPVRTENIYPTTLSPIPTAVIPEPFTRMRDDLAASEAVGTHTVTSSDIDFGGHVTNALYLRMLCDTMEVAEHTALAIREAEIQYLTPCFEGEVLTVLRRQNGDSLDFAIRKQDGKTAVLARFLAE